MHSLNYCSMQTLSELQVAVVQQNQVAEHMLAYIGKQVTLCSWLVAFITCIINAVVSEIALVCIGLNGTAVLAL